MVAREAKGAAPPAVLVAICPPMVEAICVRPLPAHRCGDGWSMAIIVVCRTGGGKAEHSALEIYSGAPH